MLYIPNVDRMVRCKSLNVKKRSCLLWMRILVDEEIVHTHKIEKISRLNFVASNLCTFAFRLTVPFRPSF